MHTFDAEYVQKRWMHAVRQEPQPAPESGCVITIDNGRGDPAVAAVVVISVRPIQTLMAR